MKVEMGIMEAKFESSQRSLEADLQSKMEKEVRNIMELKLFYHWYSKIVSGLFDSFMQQNF